MGGARGLSNQCHILSSLVALCSSCWHCYCVVLCWFYVNSLALHIGTPCFCVGGLRSVVASCWCLCVCGCEVVLVSVSSRKDLVVLVVEVVMVVGVVVVV